MNEEIDFWFDEEGDYLEIHVGPPSHDYFDPIGERVDMWECIDRKTKKVIGFNIISFKHAIKHNALTFEYEKETDTVYIEVISNQDQEVKKTVKIHESIELAYNKNGKIQRITIHNASKILNEKVMEEAVIIS